MAEKQPAADPEQVLRQTLAMIAPGTVLRDGLERIVLGRTGGLILLGHDKLVDQLTGGGFTLDVELTATRLRELAKMDGAIICDAAVSRIHKAAAQLLPDPAIPTDETGTRHRTADRIAKQTGLPVVSVSKSMSTIALYVAGRRYVLEDRAAILARADQAISTLERYKTRFDTVAGALFALEIEDLVTVRDVALVAQRLEMVRRIAREIEGYVVELGTDGRLLKMQLDELVAGIEAEREVVLRDYVPAAPKGSKAKVNAVAAQAVEGLNDSQLLDLSELANALGLGTVLDAAVGPRGYRMLARVPRLSETIVERLVSHFHRLQPLLSASIDELQMVEGVGDTRARYIRDGLARIAETTMLERFA